jgi:hypothetical protein
MNVISELDHPLITEEWTRLTNQKGRRTFALRLRNPWIDEATGTPRQKWILCSCGKLMLNLIAVLFSSENLFKNQCSFSEALRRQLLAQLLRTSVQIHNANLFTDQEFDEEGNIKTIMGCMYVSFTKILGTLN